MGRKKEIPSEKVNLEEVQKLAALGLTDVEIGRWFNLSERTINYYKKDPVFLAVLKKGKAEADLEVKRALYKRATGYSHEDVHIATYEGATIITPITKHYPPDPTSMIFWLKNREPDRWRDRREQELNITGKPITQINVTVREGKSRQIELDEVPTNGTES
jgi:hypothetical protein